MITIIEISQKTKRASCSYVPISYHYKYISVHVLSLIRFLMTYSNVLQTQFRLCSDSETTVCAGQTAWSSADCYQQ